MNEEKIEKCPVCGEAMNVPIWVGSYRICSKCARPANRNTAIKILELQHQKRLERLLDTLKKQTSELESEKVE